MPSATWCELSGASSLPLVLVSSYSWRLPLAYRHWPPCRQGPRVIYLLSPGLSSMPAMRILSGWAARVHYGMGDSSM